MAAVYEPQHMPTHSPIQLPQAAVACVGLLYDSSTNRTFRIPDVPSTSTVANIKHWYANNTSEVAIDPRSVVVIHNGQPAEDSTQVWQLAQGQGQFCVTVVQQQKSPRSMLSLYIDSSLPIPPIPLVISSDSTVLYVKQRIFEMLNMPMGVASAVNTTLILPPCATPLQNEISLGDCGVLNNTRLSLSFQENVPLDNHAGNFQPKIAPTPYTAQPQQYARIKEIWDGGNSNPGSAAQPTGRGKPTTAPTHALLPSLLFDEDDEEASALSEYLGSACNVAPMRVPACNINQNQIAINNPIIAMKGRGRRQRSRSPPGDCNHSGLSQDQLQQLAANFRTKMCRNGPACKFGRNCWFAHNDPELRKPTDPLPNNIPAVHKLERYSHREANSAKDRNVA